MKVKILQSIAGHADPRYELADFGFAPGEVVELNDELASSWIDAGIAVAYRETKGRSGRISIAAAAPTPEPSPISEPDSAPSLVSESEPVAEQVTEPEKAE